MIQAFGRRLRNEMLYTSFQIWKEGMDQKVRNNTYSAEDNNYFEANKVNYKQRLSELIDFYDHELKTKLDPIKVRSTFINCGLAPEINGAINDRNKEQYVKQDREYYKTFALMSHHNEVKLKVEPIDLTVGEDDNVADISDDTDFSDKEIPIRDDISDIGEELEIIEDFTNEDAESDDENEIEE